MSHSKLMILSKHSPVIIFADTHKYIQRGKNTSCFDCVLLQLCIKGTKGLTADPQMTILQPIDKNVACFWLKVLYIHAHLIWIYVE